MTENEKRIYEEFASGIENTKLTKDQNLRLEELLYIDSEKYNQLYEEVNIARERFQALLNELSEEGKGEMLWRTESAADGYRCNYEYVGSGLLQHYVEHSGEEHMNDCEVSL